MRNGGQYARRWVRRYISADRCEFRWWPARAASVSSMSRLKSSTLPLMEPGHARLRDAKLTRGLGLRPALLLEPLGGADHHPARSFITWLRRGRSPDRQRHCRPACGFHHSSGRQLFSWSGSIILYRLAARSMSYLAASASSWKAWRHREHGDGKLADVHHPERHWQYRGSNS